MGTECCELSIDGKRNVKVLSMYNGNVDCLTQVDPAGGLSETSLHGKTRNDIVAEQSPCSVEMVGRGVGPGIILFVQTRDDNGSQEGPIICLRGPQEQVDEEFNAPAVVVSTLYVGAAVGGKGIEATGNCQDSVEEHGML